MIEVLYLNVSNPTPFLKHFYADAAFSSYLETLGCPFSYSPDSHLEILSWLVEQGVAREFEDCCDSFVQETTSNSATSMEISSQGNEANEELKLADLEREIQSIGKQILLEKIEGESLPDYISRICVKLRFTLLAKENTTLAKTMTTGSPISLSDFPLGFDTKDDLTNKIALILKMLYLFDFRELQNDLNALIVLGQEYTANPKTNSALGQVGR